MGLVRYFNIKDKTTAPAFIKYNGICWRLVDDLKSFQGVQLTENVDAYTFDTQEKCFAFELPKPPSVPTCDEVAYQLDSNVTFDPVNSNSDTFVDMLYELKDGSVLAVETDVTTGNKSLLKSTDTSTWNTLGSTPVSSDDPVYFIYQQTQGLQAAYMGVNDQLYRSLNNGNSWSLVDTSALNISRTTAMHELTGGELVIGTAPSEAGSGGIPLPTILLQSDTTDLDTIIENKGSLDTLVISQGESGGSSSSGSSNSGGGLFLGGSSSTQSNVRHSTAQIKYGSTSIHFLQQTAISESSLVITNPTGDAPTNFFRNSSEPYTFETWFYIDTSQNGNADIILFSEITTNNTPWIHSGTGAELKLVNQSADQWSVLFRVADGGNVYPLQSRDAIISKNTWHHLAIVNRSDLTNQGELTMYVDGLRPAENTSSFISTRTMWTHDSSTTNADNDFVIGREPAGFSFFSGYIQDMMFQPGYPKYTGETYAPPAMLIDPSNRPTHVECEDVELHIQSNTTNQDSEIDDVSDRKYAIDRLASRSREWAHDTTTKPYGKSSINFIGNDQYASVGDESDWRFLHDGSKPYTIETWINIESWIDHGQDLTNIISTGGSTAKRGVWLYAEPPTAATTTHPEHGFEFRITKGASGVELVRLSTNTTVNLNQWYHLAITYDQDKYRIYVDGVLEDETGTITGHGTGAAYSPLQISLMRWENSPGVTHGNNYFQDIRISKKVQYTGNFTPPTGLLPTCNRARLTDTNGIQLWQSTDNAVNWDLIYTQPNSTGRVYTIHQGHNERIFAGLAAELGTASYKSPIGDHLIIDDDETWYSLFGDGGTGQGVNAAVQGVGTQAVSFSRNGMNVDAAIASQAQIPVGARVLIYEEKCVSTASAEQRATVGNWEWATVASYGGLLGSSATFTDWSANTGVVTFEEPLLKQYTPSNTLHIINPDRFRSLTINPGATLDVPAGESVLGGIMVLASDQLNIHGTIDLSKQGFWGGIGPQNAHGKRGKSYIHEASNTTNRNQYFGAGGAGYRSGCSNGGDVGNGGGGGGHVTAGQKGRKLSTICSDMGGWGGSALGYAALSGKVYKGPGGGSGAGDSDSSRGDGGDGGNGGGVVFIDAVNTLVSSTGQINVDGEEGEHPYDPGEGEPAGGGGGAGGSIIITGNLINDGLLTAKGGKGHGHDTRGRGGDGRISVYGLSATVGPGTPYNGVTLGSVVDPPTAGIEGWGAQGLQYASILIYSDDTVSWKYPVLGHTVRHLLSEKPGERMIACGNSEFIFTSDDNGENWNTALGTRTHYGIDSLFVVDNDHVLATLYCHEQHYRVLQSNDFGTTWLSGMDTRDSLSTDYIYTAMQHQDTGKLLLGTGVSANNIYQVNNYVEHYKDRGYHDIDMTPVDVTWGHTDMLTAVAPGYGTDTCYYFDGDSAKITGTLAESLGDGEWTIECWVNIPTSVAATTCWRCIVSIGGHATSGGVALYAPRSTNPVGTAVAILNNQRNTSDINDTIGHTKNIRDGEWHHVVLQKRRDVVRLYVDGLFENSVDDTNNYDQTTICVGKDPDCEGGSDPYGGCFRGYIKDLRITKGVGLYPTDFESYTPVRVDSMCP